jgi:hypothetical protein
LAQKRFRERGTIPQDRALFDISKCTSTRKTRCRYSKQGRRIRRNHDKMIDDAIAHLSDQPIALTTRLQEVERRQVYQI